MLSNRISLLVRCVLFIVNLNIHSILLTFDTSVLQALLEIYSAASLLRNSGLIIVASGKRSVKFVKLPDFFFFFF